MIVAAMGSSESLQALDWKLMALRRNTTILSVSYHIGRAVDDGVVHAVALSIDQECVDGRPIHARNGAALCQIRDRFLQAHNGVALLIPEEVMQGDIPDELWARKEFPNVV